MGIYIDGMEMPHDGEFNHIRIYDNGDVTVEFSDGEAVTAHASPVPPHGRLIDADEFLKRAIGTKCFRGDYALMLEELVGESITIIPADDKDINVLGKEEGET